ncbi:hypothetical protein AMECASPLE_031506 [Ameca splendens]|uniref:Uncharacterized protein n=1 Tax=Ameca splendens TaxID=208324 RepID=A0ABV1A2T5_9TELE
MQLDLDRTRTSDVCIRFDVVSGWQGGHWPGLLSTLRPEGNLKTPVKLTVMFLDCGRKLEYPERPHACTWRTRRPMQKDPRPGFEHKTFLLQLYHHADVF